MNWDKKFSVVLDCIDEREDIDCDFYLVDRHVSDDEITELTESYPLISKEYINFLKLYDSADIAQCRLFGPSKLKRAKEIYSDVFGVNEWFVFGADAGGDPILQNSIGEVYIAEGKSIEPEYSLLANSFSSFISDVLMGEKYPLVFWIQNNENDFKEFINEEKDEDPWLQFLIEKKWLTFE